MSVEQINVATVTEALVNLLTQAATVGQTGVLVERSEQIPDEPPVNGWVGIYRNLVRYPLTGSGAYQAGRKHKIELVFVFVQTDITGAACEDRLEKLIKDTMNVVLTDGCFAGTVDMIIDEVMIKYESFERSDLHYKQTAYAFVTGIKQV